jgi:hypothetical protein
VPADAALAAAGQHCLVLRRTRQNASRRSSPRPIVACGRLRVRRVLTDGTQLLKLSALDDHVRGSLLRDLEAAGLPVARIDARISDVPQPDHCWTAAVWLRSGAELTIECVARRRLAFGRVSVIQWHATASPQTPR